MRPKGMSLFRMPVLTWMLLVTQFLLLFAIPVITVALFLLMFDRLYDANFFNVDAGALEHRAHELLVDVLGAAAAGVRVQDHEELLATPRRRVDLLLPLQRDLLLPPAANVASADDFPDD